MTPELERRRRCYNAVKIAIKIGRLVRPEVCSFCGVKCKPDAHHDDYDEPLKVDWACRTCHRKLDAMATLKRMGVEKLL
jgi:hypothetical protein